MLARTGLFATASLVTLALATPAVAQVASTVAASPSTADNGDIVVTARRVAENLQSVPLAVSAVSGASLQRQAIREIRDLSSTVPNLQIKQSNSGGGSVVLTIRGQSQAASIVQYVDPAVGVYVDGLNVPRNVGLKTGLIDIKRVEVLRGPQGTLYGRNTTGGAVSIVTEDPKPELGAMISGSYGNYDSWNIAGTLNIPLAEGVGLRVTGQHGARGALGHQVLTGQKLASEETTYFRAKLKIDRGAFKVTLSGDYFNYDGDGQIGKMSGLVPADASSPNAAKYSGRVCLPTATGLTGADPNRLGGACTPTGGATNSGTFYGVTGGTAANIARQYLGLANTAAGVDAGSAYLQQFVQRGDNPVSGRFWDTFQTSAGSYFGQPNYADNTSTSSGGSATLNLEYEASDQITLKSISGWRTWKRYDAYDLDGTPVPIYGTRNGTPYADFYSQELQLLGNFDRLSFVSGLYYGYEKGLDYSPTAQLQTPGSLAYSLNDATVTNLTKAVFAQANFKITDKLTVTLGGRYTQEVRKADIRNRQISSTGVATCGLPYTLLNNPNGGGAPQANATVSGATVSVQCLSSQRTAASEPSWLASLNYQATPDVLVYLKASRGFRAGAVQARTNSTVVAAFTPVLPEFVTEFEGGLKSDLFDRRLRLNLAAFYDKYTNAQRTVTLARTDAPGTYSLLTNAGRARLWGIEGEASLKVTPEFTVGGNFGYLNPKYLEFQDIVLGDRTGEPWPAPKFTYTVDARYDTHIGDSASLSAYLQWVWTGERNLQPQALIRSENVQPGYGLLNGSLTVRLDDAGLEASLYGRNLLNKKYDIAGTSLESVGFNVLFAGEPRMFGLQLTKRFGGEK